MPCKGGGDIEKETTRNLGDALRGGVGLSSQQLNERCTCAFERKDVRESPKN